MLFRSGSVNDSDIVVLGLELPEGDIDGDTTLTLGLELVKNPRVLEGTLAELSGFLCGATPFSIMNQLWARIVSVCGAGFSRHMKFSPRWGWLAENDEGLSRYKWRGRWLDAWVKSWRQDFPRSLRIMSALR